MKRLSDHLADAGFALLTALSVGFLLIPLLLGIVISLDDREYIGPFPPPALSFRWYEALLSNSSYADGLRVSLEIGILATLVSSLAGIGAALFLTRYKVPGGTFLETLLLSPKFVPTVVLGFALLSVAGVLGIVNGWWRLLAGHIIITLPFTLRACLAAVGGIRGSLVEAAMSLGANERQATTDIVLPLARTGVVSGALFAFVLSFDEVAVSLFLSDPFTTTLPVALVAEMRANLNLTIAAVSTLFFLFTIVLVVVLDRFFGLDRLFGEGIYRP